MLLVVPETTEPISERSSEKSAVANDLVSDNDLESEKDENDFESLNDFLDSTFIVEFLAPVSAPSLAALIEQSKKRNQKMRKF